MKQALVDCNNFFVSCERVFNPQLRNHPVVVLSSNDGCIIARSQEAKALGIPMGAPYFEWADFMRIHDVKLCSSNFCLYGDFSERVMSTLSHFNPELEIYSIDEAFLNLEGIADPKSHCENLRKTVVQWTGIPISIGVGPTKTLAKVANQLAKKDPQLKGVSIPSKAEFTTILASLPTQEVWGIGSRTSRFLATKGIHTAGQLIQKEDLWIKQHLTVVGLRTVWELRGISCFDVEETPSPKQSILTSRSFGSPIFAKSALLEAVASFATRAAEKLREEKQRANWLQVFIQTSRHKEEYYSNSIIVNLSESTQYTPTLLNAAQKGLEAIYKEGPAYKRAGILLGGLVSEEEVQSDLFAPLSQEEASKQTALMKLMDEANEKFGYSILQFASAGSKKTPSTWKPQKNLRSPAFTTNWKELLIVKI